MRKMRIERYWSMPNANTVDVWPVAERILLERHHNEGLWIDPFAGKNKLADVTNDLNPTFDTDFHLDALDFLKQFKNGEVAGVLYDPPYSPRQVSECYHGVGKNCTMTDTDASFWAKHKQQLERIVRVGGTVITIGCNSGGIGKKYGFQLKDILLIAHGGWHNDTIVTVETRMPKQLSLV